MLYKKQNNKNAWTGTQPCGFIFISFTHLFSLTHWNDCSRLQVCLQLWEFPRCNYRLFPDIFTVVPPPTLPPHLRIWSWRPGYTAALQNPSSRTPLTTTSTTSYWPLRSLTALLPVFHPSSIHPRIPPAPSFTIRDPTSNGVAALQEAVSLHHRPLFERFWFIVGSHPSQPGPVVSESVDTGYCPGLTFLCVSVHVVDNRTLYRENAVKIMIEGVFNHWIMHHSVQR